MTNEDWYDANIAPDLHRLCKLCEKRGLSFLATVEFGLGETASTLTLAPDAGAKPRIVGMAIMAHGNVDALITNIMRYAREHGHSSAALAVLGVEPSC